MKRSLVLFICLALLIAMIPSIVLASSAPVSDPRQAIQAEFNYQKDVLSFNPGNLLDDKVDNQWNDDGYSARCIWYSNGDSTATVFSRSGPWYQIFGDAFWGVFTHSALTVIFATQVDGGYVGYTVKNDIQNAAWWTSDEPSLHKGLAAVGPPISNEFWAEDNDGNKFLAQNFKDGAAWVYYDTSGNVVSSGKQRGISFEPAGEPPPPSDVIYGDVNDDEQVTNVDLILLKRHIAGIAVSPFNEEAADVNGDDQITNVDLILLQRFLAGVIDKLRA